MARVGGGSTPAGSLISSRMHNPNVHTLTYFGTAGVGPAGYRQPGDR